MGDGAELHLVDRGAGMSRVLRMRIWQSVGYSIAVEYPDLIVWIEGSEVMVGADRPVANPDRWDRKERRRLRGQRIYPWRLGDADSVPEPGSAGAQLVKVWVPHHIPDPHAEMALSAGQFFRFTGTTQTGQTNHVAFDDRSLVFNPGTQLEARELGQVRSYLAARREAERSR